LRGMFSVLVWDKENETFYGARDPFGIKPLFYYETDEGAKAAPPLFYYETDEGAAFASEKKSIVCMLETEEVSEEALHHYLSFQYVPEPMTMTQGIKKVEPGHYFIKKPGNPIIFERYWHATFNP